MHHIDPNRKCPVAQQVKAVLATPFKWPRLRFRRSLAQTSLQDVTAAFH